MKKISYTFLAISFLIVLNLTIVSFLFYGHHKSHHPLVNEKRHDKNNSGMHSPVNHFGGSKRFGHRGAQRMKELNLTEEQKQKMEPFRKDLREQSSVLLEKIDNLRSRELELQKSGRLDNIQKNAMATEFGQHQKELHLLKLNYLENVRNLLTKEQKEKFEKRFEDRNRDEMSEHLIND